LRQGSGGTKTDFWSYDTTTNTWTPMATFPGSARYDASVFVLGQKAYMVGGSTGGPPYLNEVWCYNAANNTWTQKNNSPAGDMEGMAAISIGNHGYTAVAGMAVLKVLFGNTTPQTIHGLPLQVTLSPIV